MTRTKSFTSVILRLNLSRLSSRFAAGAHCGRRTASSSSAGYGSPRRPAQRFVEVFHRHPRFYQTLISVLGDVRQAFAGLSRILGNGRRSSLAARILRPVAGKVSLASRTFFKIVLACRILIRDKGIEPGHKSVHIIQDGLHVVFVAGHQQVQPFSELRPGAGGRAYVVAGPFQARDGLTCAWRRLPPPWRRSERPAAPCGIPWPDHGIR